MKAHSGPRPFSCVLPPHYHHPSRPTLFHPNPAPFQPRIPRSRARTPGSTGNDAHAHRKSDFNRVFPETERFKAHLNLHDSGLPAGPENGEVGEGI